MQEKRLQYQLEIQSRQIETVLTKHDVAARVAGGFVQPRWIRFDLAGHVGSSLDRLRHMKQELLAALGAADGELSPHADGWHLLIARTEDVPVSLLDLLPMTTELKPMSVMLGLDENGRALCWQLSPDNLPHILVTGVENAGKTSLLRTVALSLALLHRQSQLQLMVIDGSTSGKFEAYTALEPLSYLPHMLGPVAYDADDYREMLDFLSGECLYRQEQQMNTPKIVVMIDEVVNLLRSGKESQQLVESIVLLLQRGPAVGIHLILTTNNPEAEQLNSTFRMNLPGRIVGKTRHEAQAAAAADMPGTQAEYLLGQGDFLAVMDGVMTHFQAAHIGEYDLQLTLDALQRRRPQPLLAQQVQLESLAIKAEKPDNNERQTFTSSASGIEFTS
ncbi:MAG TPA: FtsK/SpoIIIE domain-containing protein [Chloroflexota bacterium]|nr:FtsK/SpoIIIE domain-containing protein [Chloroflexota bacterium]HUM69442.1 FtsK/SpoIIIE domain-containing protein [Chloroflexota bacterium]